MGKFKNQHRLKLIALVIFTGSIFSGFTKDFCFNKPLTSDSTVTVPLGGNAWRNGTGTEGGSISNEGIVNWTNSDVKFTTYVRIAKTGKLRLWINISVPHGKSHIAVFVLKNTKRILAMGALKRYYLGEWNIVDTGYLALQIKGIDKTGYKYADITSLSVAGSTIGGKIAFVKNNDGNYFYWGRRGPSVHLGYQVPGKMDAAWFYNEVTVPKGNDVTGSYFMADGFAEGYFGMQVNGSAERRILFSVWSPFKTDDPQKIPEDQKIAMLKKGSNVHAGEFGDEGSGGQSYLVYNWKAGATYKFLIHAKPAEGNHTIYTAWFFAPELNNWLLIASFSRPQTNTFLKHLHSFLENFDPEQGNITRAVLFTNQWVADETGRWRELNETKFTIDNTGAKGYRMDYSGGTTGKAFYLKNCGFFNNFTPANTLFKRPFSTMMPNIDLTSLL